jgi:hypothetical protein
VLIEDLTARGAAFRVDGDDIVVTAAKGVVTAADRAALAAVKAEAVHTLRLREPRQFSPLVEYAASRLPRIRMTVRETGDTERDFGLINRLRRAIEEFQPGGNHVYLTIVTLGGRRVTVEWRAVADRPLRLMLGDILAQAADVNSEAVRRFGGEGRGSRALRLYSRLHPRSALDARAEPPAP